MRRVVFLLLPGLCLVSAASAAPVARVSLVPTAAPQAGVSPQTVGGFLAELRARMDALPRDPFRSEFHELAQRELLPESEAMLGDYIRLRTVFEATRDGGYFGLRWAITDQQPSSRLIWSAWQRVPPTSLEAPTATAECDEISALAAFLGHGMGVRRLGLYWPTPNHTILAWEPQGTSVRVLVPTTQIFQSCEATLGRVTFSKTAQRTVFDYALRDVPDNAAAPAAAFLLAQLSVYAPASRDMLALLRLHRGARYGSSFRDCDGERRTLATRLGQSPLSPEDARALSHYVQGEMHSREVSPAAQLALVSP